jgi:anti-anti-sigma factor
MREVRFVDSSGMGALVAAQKLAMQKGGRLSLHDVAPNVARALQMAGLVDVLAVSPRRTNFVE